MPRINAHPKVYAKCGHATHCQHHSDFLHDTFGSHVISGHHSECQAFRQPGHLNINLHHFFRCGFMTEKLFPKLKDGDQECGHPNVSGKYGGHVLPCGHKYIYIHLLEDMQQKSKHTEKVPQ
jgi:hypothetical protein